MSLRIADLLAIFGQFYVGAELFDEASNLILGVTLILRYGLHPSHISQKSVGQIFGCYPCATRQGAFFLAATFFFEVLAIRISFQLCHLPLSRVCA